MTLQEIIARYHAAQPAPTADEPIPYTLAVMTPRGVACVQVVRLEQALADLDRADRAYVVGRLRALLDDLTATTA
jgi:hypothetical protein